jgi:hypothetical protein
MNSEVQLVIALLSLAGAVIGLVGTLIGRRQVVVLQRQPGAADASQPASTPRATVGLTGDSWYDHPGWILFWLVFFWPVGLYALCRSRWVKGSWKTGALAALGVLFLLAMMA